MVDDVFDLEAQRTARREKTGRDPIVLRLNGREHTLPPELPLDVLAPLESVDVDVALLMRLALDAQDGKPNVAADATNVVIDMLITNPALPKEVLGAIRQMGRNLLGDAYDDLMASRPSPEDLAALAKYLYGKYQVTPPEALGSSESPGDGGPTLSAISNASTDSTPEASGAPLATPALSGSAV